MNSTDVIKYAATFRANIDKLLKVLVGLHKFTLAEAKINPEIAVDQKTPLFKKIRNLEEFLDKYINNLLKFIKDNFNNDNFSEYLTEVRGLHDLFNEKRSLFNLILDSIQVDAIFVNSSDTMELQSYYNIVEQFLHLMLATREEMYEISINGSILIPNGLLLIELNSKILAKLDELLIKYDGDFKTLKKIKIYHDSFFNIKRTYRSIITSNDHLNIYFYSERNLVRTN